VDEPASVPAAEAESDGAAEVASADGAAVAEETAEEPAEA
jgi:hypothetical protein